MNRDSSIGVAIGYELDVRILIPEKAGECVLLHSVQTSSEARPNSYGWVPKPLSSGAKRPGREADHSPPSIAEVKNGGAIRFHGVVCNEAQKQLYLFYTVLWNVSSV
jgi:hypothetical protein